MKNYKTLANAYTTALKRELVPYDLKGGYDLLDDLLVQKGYTKAMRTVALANVMACVDLLARDNGDDWEELFVLKQTDEGFAWDRVGMIEHDDEGENVMFDKPKAKKTVSRAYDPAQEYEDLMEGYNPSKPTPAKRVRKAKGNGIDFNAFKGTKSEKNRALHAELVSRGLKDSRSDEYQAIWQSRPWAKA